MATSTLRFAIIVVLVAGGAVLIARFPDASTSAIGGSTPSPTETPTSSANGQNTNDNTGGGQQTPAPPVEGVRLAVYNGTYETGLAATVTEKLERRGYKINHETSILDAPSKPVEQTTLYFVTSADKPAAEALADGFFKRLDVKIGKLPADTQVPAGVQVAVYLGTDYALRQ